MLQPLRSGAKLGKLTRNALDFETADRLNHAGFLRSLAGFALAGFGRDHLWFGGGFGCCVSGGVFIQDTRLLVSKGDAVDDGYGGQNSQHPEHRSHGSPAGKQSSNDHQHNALGTFHEAYLARPDERFGAGTGVAHHNRADHDDGDQYQVEEAVGAGIINQQAKEERHIAVAVDDRIKEAAKGGDLVGSAGHAAINHVKDSSPNDHQPGIEEHARVISGTGKTEENRGNNVDDQADEGEYVGRDAGEGQPANNRVQQHSAGPSKSPGPGHCASSWIVVSCNISISRFPLGVTTVAVSPTFLPINALPMGEVVEINPLVTSDSSLVTSLYSSSSSLVLSKTRMRDPKATRSLGMLVRLTSANSLMRFLSWPRRAFT